jgi:hypothetical protein
MPQPRAIVPDQGGVRACLNNTGVTIAKYRLVKKVTTAVAPAVDGAAPIYAATMAAIADGFAGDGQVAGRALVEAGGVITIGQNVTGGTGGKGAVASAGDYSIGPAASAAAADGDIIEVDLLRTLVHA